MWQGACTYTAGAERHAPILHTFGPGQHVASGAPRSKRGIETLEYYLLMFLRKIWCSPSASRCMVGPNVMRPHARRRRRGCLHTLPRTPQTLDSAVCKSIRFLRDIHVISCAMICGMPQCVLHAVPPATRRRGPSPLAAGALVLPLRTCGTPLSTISAPFKYALLRTHPRS